jgi:hypothetical protein
VTEYGRKEGIWYENCGSRNRQRRAEHLVSRRELDFDCFERERERERTEGFQVAWIAIKEVRREAGRSDEGTRGIPFDDTPR